jgi:glucose/arabinose dehydrogenase
MVTRSLTKAVYTATVLLMYFHVSAQNLFVADYNGFKGVYQIKADGTQSNFISGLNTPSSLAFDKVGNLYVADAGSSTIIKITPAGVTNTVASGLNFPYGLAFDQAGNLFESDYGSSWIYEFTNHNGTVTSNLNVFASIGLNGPVGLAFNSASNLFEADFKSGKIYEFTNRNGILVSNLNVFVSGVTNPSGLAFNSSNILFVANDTGVGSITRVMPNGTTNNFASGLAQPFGLAFNNAGNLFVANQNQQNIIQITPDGTQTIYFSGPSTNYPSGIAFAPTAQLHAAIVNKSIRLTVACPSPYFSAIVESSTNLMKWTSIYTNMAPFTFTDTITAAPYRFYRSVLAP